MKLVNPTAEIFVPDGVSVEAALGRTTAMGVVAHQDDMEILAYHGIVQAFGKTNEWYSGAVVTNGSGSARAGLYADYTDAQMCTVRRQEQKKAAVVGDYSAVALLDYTSAVVKNPREQGPVADLVALILAARPQVIYTHNLADKHDTHVAVALRLIQALRQVPAAARPRKLYGCEVWRDLDWLCDSDKVALRVDSHESLAAALLGVYDSQIAGGKRYDLATIGRRRANATFFASHGVDDSEGLTFAIDMTALIADPSLAPAAFIADFMDRFVAEVKGRVATFSAP